MKFIRQYPHKTQQYKPIMYAFNSRQMTSFEAFMWKFSFMM